LIAPLFIFLVLGMIELGRGINVQHALLNAARAGCRIGITEGATLQDISDRVADNLAGAAIEEYSVSVSPDPLSSAANGDAVSVTVSVTYADVNWVPAPRFLADKTLSGLCSLPRE
jgi:Flp pilus assembly protein TadG